LGTAKFYTGEHDKAEQLYQRALEITEKVYPPDSPRVASAAAYLAEYYLAVGDFKKAEPLLQRIFAVAEKRTPSGDSEDFRKARDRYACVLHKIGQEDRAQELEKRPLLSGIPATPVTGSVLKGKAISLPRPSYPDEARAARVSGTVLVQLVIDEGGKVLRACAIKGPPLLMRTSEVAAYNAVFTPTKLSGKPVQVTGLVTYNFVVR
jgi:tetratricopeptide (TPR) repeat protein